MARPQRHNVDYFPHYISDGKKMFVIEAKFGNDGYAVWFKILETLAKTDNHFVNCNDESNLMFLAAKCRVTEDNLIDIIDAIVKLGELDSILWNQCRVIWSDKFIESIQDAYKKRSNKCMTKIQLITEFNRLGIPKPDFNEVSDSLNQVNSPVNPQSKVKESKVKESKEEGSNARTYESIKKATIELIANMGLSEKDFPVDQLSRKFFDHYESKNWIVNGDKIVRWKSKLSIWIVEHLSDPTRLLGKNHNKISKEQEEEMDIAILKHQRDVLAGKYDNQPSENHRLRRLP